MYLFVNGLRHSHTPSLAWFVRLSGAGVAVWVLASDCQGIVSTLCPSQSVSAGVISGIPDEIAAVSLLRDEHRLQP